MTPPYQAATGSAKPRGHGLRVGVPAALIAIGLLGAAGCTSGSDGKAAAAAAASASAKAAADQAAAKAAADQAAREAAAKAALGTLAQQKAGRAAKQYLDAKPWTDYLNAQSPDISAFPGYSRAGLIRLLRAKGYSLGDATWGVDHQHVDWNAQANKLGVQLINKAAFTPDDLMTYLLGRGFTRPQATYAVHKAFSL